MVAQGCLSMAMQAESDSETFASPLGWQIEATLSTACPPASALYLPADSEIWVKKKGYEWTLKLPQRMVLRLLRMEAGGTSCVPSFSFASARPTSGPTSCPRAPPVSALYLLNGVVADQVHCLVPSAAPDADAATGVDGTAQPIGGCPHHLRKDKHREAMRRIQWDPGFLGVGRLLDLPQGGCTKGHLPVSW